MQPDVVKAFCVRNKLDMIIRAHECVMDGFERFAGGKLITVFSATNYCGTYVIICYDKHFDFSRRHLLLGFGKRRDTKHGGHIVINRDCSKCWSHTGNW